MDLASKPEVVGHQTSLKAIFISQYFTERENSCSIPTDL